MSNHANYSPYNKSYKFILFQNQAYHQRNKRNISPCVRTNLRHSLSRNSYKKNPERFDVHNKLLQLNFSNAKLSDYQDSQTQRSSLFEKRKEIQNAFISEPKRIVHKNLSFEKFNQQKINQQNVEMVSRILNSECQIIQKISAEKSFKNHLKYQNIRRRYNEGGQRKDVMPLGQSQLLCPTLMQFNTSGLGSKFVEMDMSMSIKPSTAQSLRKTYRDSSS